MMYFVSRRLHYFMGTGAVLGTCWKETGGPRADRILPPKKIKNKYGTDSAECCCRVLRRIISNIHIEFFSKAALD
jgi:hypothetical protein